MTEEYQGGATTTLVIHHAEDSDRGTYTLKAENRQGSPRLRHVCPGEQAVLMHSFIHRERPVDVRPHGVPGVLQQWSLVLNSSPDDTMKKLLEGSIQFTDSHMF